MRSGAPAMPFTTGVVVGQVLAWFATNYIIAIALTALGGLIALKRRGVSALLLGTVVGLLCCVHLRGEQRASRSSADTEVLLRIIESPSRRKPGEVTFVGEAESVDRGNFRCRAVDLPWRNVADLREGDVVWVRGEASPVVRPLNPFSWEAYLWRRGIATDLKARFVSKAVTSKESFSAQVRTSIKRIVARADSLNRGESLFLSMVFGFKDLLSADVEDAFKKLGLTHLLVVSGYQVSLVFGVCVFVSRVVAGWCAGRVVLRSLVNCLAWGMSLLYVTVIGFEMSAVRALIAAACVCADLVLERSSGFAQRWWVALLMVNILSPWSFFEIGVILTFAALAGIGIGITLGGQRQVATYLWINIAVWLSTSSVMLLWVGSISLVSILLNVLVPGPWSFLNCTVGMIGLLLFTLGLDSHGALLWAVTSANDCVATYLVNLSRTLTATVELQGAERWGCAGALIAISGWLYFRSARKYRIPVRLLSGGRKSLS